MEVIREVFLYMIFLYLLMMVSYGNRDPVSHRLYSSLYQEFHDAAYLPEDGVTLDSVCHLIQGMLKLELSSYLMEIPYYASACMGMLHKSSSYWLFITQVKSTLS